MSDRTRTSPFSAFCAAGPVTSSAPRVREGVLRPDMLRRVLGADLQAPLLLAAGEAPGKTTMKFIVGNQQTLFIRLWVIYATEDDGTVDGKPARSRAELLPVIQAVVDGMRKDWAGTGIEWVFLPQRDFEIRKDSKLFQTFTLTPAQKKFPAKQSAYTKEAIDAIIAGGSSSPHRNAVAAERPNTLLWIMGANSAITLDKTSAANVQPEVWQWLHHPHVSGSFSGGDIDFALLNQFDLASSVKASGDDASRAAHETGHFLHLPHTHREDPPLHDEEAHAETATAAERLQAWQKRIGGWIDANVPAKSTSAKALEIYDADRSAVPDTPADPGPGLLFLANGGKKGDEMGPISSVTIQTKNAGAVVFQPDRSNPMSYFLGGKPADPMRFSPDQIARMRGALTGGNRRRLVAAQLGDTAEAGVRIAAVWSPSAKGQGVTWRKDVATLKQRHATHAGNGLRMTGMSAYVVGGQVFYDAFWDEGAKQQPLLLGWSEADALKEITTRSKAGWQVSHAQAYRHPGTDLRYNVIFEQGLPPQRVWLNQTSAQVDALWKTRMPAGERFRHLDCNTDHNGEIRYCVIMETAGQVQRPLWGWALEHLAAEYGKEWNAGRRLRCLSVAQTSAGPRYSAIFDAESSGQLVYWLHTRERIGEIYDEMWWQGFKLRSLDTIGV